jgi:hypothetical protein
MVLALAGDSTITKFFDMEGVFGPGFAFKYRGELLKINKPTIFGTGF